jgi:CheY-like chemotaxis protein
MELAVGEVRIAEAASSPASCEDLTERQQTETRLQELQSELVHVSRLTALGEMASAWRTSSISRSRRSPTTSREARCCSDATRCRTQGGAGGRKAADEALRAGQIFAACATFVSRGEPSAASKAAQADRGGERAGVGRAKEHGIRVVFDFDRDVDLVLADRVQVQQVVLNLIRNAVDAMVECRRAATSSVTICVRREMALVCVADTSPGSAPTSPTQLFQPFIHHQAQRHGRRPVHLAHDHRGAWAGASGPSRTRMAAPRSASPCRASTTESFAMASEPVVHVIDDDEAARDSLSFLIDCAGPPRPLVPSAIDFLEASQRWSTLHRTDVRMPEMSGVELVGG